MLIVSEQFRCLSSSSSCHFVLCTDRCDVPLGIQDGRITRSMFTASSMYNHYYGPWCARLQAQNRGQTRGGWIAKYRNTKQWLQVDLGTVSIVKRIATQARYDANQWVTSYTVSYSNNGVRFFPYKQARRTRVRMFLFVSTWLVREGHMRRLTLFYRVAGCPSRQDKANPAFWFDTRGGKIGLYCLLEFFPLGSASHIINFLMTELVRSRTCPTSGHLCWRLVSKALYTVYSNFWPQSFKRWIALSSG